MPHSALSTDAGGQRGEESVRRHLVYLAAFLMDICFSCSSVGVVYHAKAVFKATQADLGLFALLSAAAYVVSSYSLGRLSDRWGRRSSVVLGCALNAAILLAAPWVYRFWQLYAVLMIAAAGQGAFWPTLEADISDHSTPRELPRRLGRFNVAWGLGITLGGLCAGMLGEALGQPAVFLAGSLAAAATLVAFLLRTYVSEEAAGPAEAADKDPAAAVRADRFWKMALALNFAATGLASTVRAQMPAVTGGEHSSLGGIYLALFFGAEMATFIAFSQWHRWHYRVAPLACGGLSAVAGALLCGVSAARPAVFAAGCLLGGIGVGVAYYSSLYYSLMAASNRGHRGGIHEAVLAAGSAAVPWVGGLLASVAWIQGVVPWPAGIPHLTAGLVLVALLAGSGWLYAARRRSSPNPGA